MSDILINDPATLYEISRRVDSVEDEIKNIRQRLHDNISEQNNMMIAIHEMDNNITNMSEKITKIYHNQKSISEKLLDLEKSFDLRITNIEKKSNILDFLFSHWKFFAFFGLFCLALGIGLDEILKVGLPEKIISSVQSK